MKYCRSCKTRARDDAETCATCGQPLAVFGFGGAAAEGAGAAPAVLELRGEIEQLRATRDRQSRLGRRLMTVCAVVAAAFLLVGYRVYASTVLVYAKLADVEIRQDPQQPLRIVTSFRVVTPGKVSFERRSGGARTEKIDWFDDRQEVEQSWTWPSDPTSGIEFDVVYRTGWSRSFERKRFNIDADKLRPAVDVVFLLDTTVSMDEYIDGLKRKCIDFAAEVRRGRVVRLGLVAYGDVGIKEPIRVFPLTDEIQQFQTNVANVPRNSGGDDPESSVDALEKGLSLEFRPNANVCFVLVTDADTHRAQELRRIERALQERGIVSFVVSRGEFERVYARICVNGGEFKSIDNADFATLLDGVAEKLNAAIRSR
jgi:Mg-chelatase subunit ChlD